jgi:hypothetical protein
MGGSSKEPANAASILQLLETVGKKREAGGRKTSRNFSSERAAFFMSAR